MTITLKKRYRRKWRVSLRRELLTYNILNILLEPYDFMIVFSGIGSGTADYVDESYSNPVNAFDFIVLNENGEVVAYLDVTGYSDYREAKGDTKPCILLPKLWKAEEFNITDKVWFIHFVDSRISLRFIRATALRKYLDQNKAELRKLLHGERPYICIDQKYWQEPKDFIRWLLLKVRQ